MKKTEGRKSCDTVPLRTERKKHENIFRKTQGKFRFAKIFVFAKNLRSLYGFREKFSLSHSLRENSAKNEFYSNDFLITSWVRIRTPNGIFSQKLSRKISIK
jgi:hypothetical protein